MSPDEQHIALPKLYGAPAYARPRAPVDHTPRPLNPDDLPLEVEQTEEDRLAAAALQRARADAQPHSNGRTPSTGRSRSGLGGQPFNLKELAGRLLGGQR